MTADRSKVVEEDADVEVRGGTRNYNVTLLEYQGSEVAKKTDVPAAPPKSAFASVVLPGGLVAAESSNITSAGHNGTGDWSIHVDAAGFTQKPVVSAQLVGSAVGSTKVTVSSATLVRVFTLDAAGVVQDVAFNLLCLGN